MVILASIEASLRGDYLSRCRTIQKDQLSRELRKLYKKKRRKVSLFSDLLEITPD